MGLCDVVDELLDEHSLADTGTTEETNLAATCVGREQVDNLDTGLEDLSGGRLVDERGRLCVDRAELVALDGSTLVDGLANDVHDTTERLATDGDTDRRARVDDLLATDETLGTVHGNGTHRVLTQVRGNLEDEATAVEVLDLERVENGRQVVRLELDVDDGTNDRLDRTNDRLGLGRVRTSGEMRV